MSKRKLPRVWVSKGKPVYHVTHTKNVKSIKKHGLIPGVFPTNWVKRGSGERYGEGEVHAFELFHDAVLWASNMAWTFYQDQTSGKVSIVEIATHKGDQWEIDYSDPLSQMSSLGLWLKTDDDVPPEDIKGAKKLTLAMIRKVVADDKKRYE